MRIAAGLGVNPGDLVADLSDDDLPERPPTVSGIERLKMLREQQGR
ncbi:hypothetical protein [Compostimonas suwonensis]|nr:hypothetical protein [Compostimonas suwonensis]